MKKVFAFFILAGIGGVAFAAGILWSQQGHADDAPAKTPAPVRTEYPKKTELDFEGTQIEGEIRNPGEFYFQHRNEEKFDSLVKRRKDFHQEMLRDAVLTK